MNELYITMKLWHVYINLVKKTKKKNRKRGINKKDGLVKLEAICSKIEQDFDVNISFVFCNRFQDPNHRVDWHKDTYGEHICVLTFGSKRRIEFRNNKTMQIEQLTPAAGDLYVMPLHLNKTHQHRVCSAIETAAISTRSSLDDNNDPIEKNNTNSRLSFVFFFEASLYAKEFKIPRKDRLAGFLEGIREKTGLW